jgi:hypothetical protein
VPSGEKARRTHEMPCLLKPLLVDGHDKVTELKKQTVLTINI